MVPVMRLVTAPMPSWTELAIDVDERCRLWRSSGDLEGSGVREPDLETGQFQTSISMHRQPLLRT